MKAKRRRLDAILRLTAKGWTSGQIAVALGCSATYVRAQLDLMGTPARQYASPKEALQELAASDPVLYAEVESIREDWAQQKERVTFHENQERKDGEKV